MRPIDPAEFDVMTSADMLARLHDRTSEDPTLRRARREETGKIRRRARREAIARARTLATALSLVSGGSVLPVAMVGHKVH